MQRFHSIWAGSFYGDGRDRIRKLNEEAQKIDLNNVMLVCMEESGSFDHDLVTFMLAVVGDRTFIKPNPHAFTIRELIPAYDFVDIDGSSADNSWNIKLKEQHYYYYKGVYSPISQSILGINPNLHSKCIAITGVEYNPEKCVIDEVQFWVKGVKLIDRHLLNRCSNYYKFKTPFILGLTSSENEANLDIKVTVSKDKRDMETKMRLTGYVAEPLGIPPSDLKMSEGLPSTSSSSMSYVFSFFAATSFSAFTFIFTQRLQSIIYSFRL